MDRRKIEILKYVRDRELVTAREVANDLGLEIHNARALLRKYRLQGLIRVNSIDFWGTKRYRITQKGLKRIEWLEALSKTTQGRFLDKSTRPSYEG